MNALYNNSGRINLDNRKTYPAVTELQKNSFRTNTENKLLHKKTTLRAIFSKEFTVLDLPNAKHYFKS